MKFSLITTILLFPLAIALALAAPLDAQVVRNELSYDWKSGQTVTYDVNYREKFDGQLRRIHGQLTFTLKQRNITKGFDGERLADARAGQSTSTAFIVSPQGHLLTCEHCVRYTTRINVSIGGKKYAAKVLEADRVNDLALLQIVPSKTDNDEANQTFPFLPLGEKQPVLLAQDIHVIGYPLSSLLGSSIKITRGSIAGFIGGQPGGFLKAQSYQVDAAVNPGNSGGPLIDKTGAVIGVINAKLQANEINKVGFAIPVRLATEMLRRNGVKFTSSVSTKILNGPKLAAQATPAVAFIEATSNPNMTDNLLFHITGKLNHFGENRSIIGRIIATKQGKIIDQENVPSFNALLQSAASLLFMELPNTQIKKWNLQRIFPLEFNETEPTRRSNAPVQLSLPTGRTIFRSRGFGRTIPRQQSNRQIICTASRSFELLENPPAIPALIQIYEDSKTENLARNESQKIRQNYKSMWNFNGDTGLVERRRIKGTTTVRTSGDEKEIPFDISFSLAGSKLIKLDKGFPETAPAGTEDSATVPNALASQATDRLTEQQLKDFLSTDKNLDRSTTLKYLSRLSKWKDEQHVPAVTHCLLKMADTRDSTIKNLALAALLHWSPGSATDLVIEQLDQASTFSQRAWIVKLGKTGTAEAAEKLCELLTNRQTAGTTERALAKMGKVAEPALFALIKTLIAKANTSQAQSDKLEPTLLQSLKLLRPVISPESRAQLRELPQTDKLSKSVTTTIAKLLK